MMLSQKLKDHIKACKPSASSMTHEGLVAMECDEGNDLALDNERDVALEKGTT